MSACVERVETIVRVVRPEIVNTDEDKVVKGADDELNKVEEESIKSCLISSSVSILVNGSPTKEFNLGRGVRQGDPLAPFLFIIATEGLNWLTKSAVSKNLYSGVEIGKDKFPLSHLQYADDTIFFGKWSLDNFENLMKLLECFELCSGLKVNYTKSNLFGVGVEKNDVYG
ncbi:uncharacterized mitochondrial protein AtMg01250-like [Rutidosis leptorrhynchoides]|uniref:uncharacterized mitochondrial protein AtMg01250-like n=1 Tax=Rutidosis leptorrhynchoides TaxID=125765 RepID=UPI003A997882